MQLSVLFSALVSFVILAAASPASGAISKCSSKRENLGINFQRDLQEESNLKKREELETDIMSYAASYPQPEGAGWLLRGDCLCRETWLLKSDLKIQGFLSESSLENLASSFTGLQQFWLSKIDRDEGAKLT
ncbi:hypothetical protein EV702DRAFT_1254504 [Suillus placidus]|uniref:Uncharacterized protein n=1 Tax=Suillus placidus TaxID=48579 RepID=A0A9P6ZIC9_9AGAM|nr:hypothetical protein EV702DRAFT_1254504 [Suillus placidus]